MQIKMIIICILIFSSYLIGENISKYYINRHKQINELIRVLEIIRMELSFGVYTLGEIFSKLSSKVDFITSKFFAKVSETLINEPYKTLDEVIKESTYILKEETNLNYKDIYELRELITTLGKSDVSSQSRLIDLSIENYKKITIDTKEDIEKKGNVYKKLSTITGVILGIILI